MEKKLLEQRRPMPEEWTINNLRTIMVEERSGFTNMQRIFWQNLVKGGLLGMGFGVFDVL